MVYWMLQYIYIYIYMQAYTVDLGFDAFWSGNGKEGGGGEGKEKSVGM